MRVRGASSVTAGNPPRYSSRGQPINDACCVLVQGLLTACAFFVGFCVAILPCIYVIVVFCLGLPCRGRNVTQIAGNLQHKRICMQTHSRPRRTHKTSENSRITTHNAMFHRSKLYMLHLPQLYRTVYWAWTN